MLSLPDGEACTLWRQRLSDAAVGSVSSDVAIAVDVARGAARSIFQRDPLNRSGHSWPAESAAGALDDDDDDDDDDEQVVALLSMLSASVLSSAVFRGPAAWAVSKSEELSVIGKFSALWLL